MSWWIIGGGVFAGLVVLGWISEVLQKKPDYADRQATALNELEQAAEEHARHQREAEEAMQAVRDAAPHEKAQKTAELEEVLRRHSREMQARLDANAHQFPEPEVTDLFLRAGLCNGPQVESLINAGYRTIEAVAHAEVNAIKKLPKFGSKSAPATINAARHKLGLSPLNL